VRFRGQLLVGPRIATAATAISLIAACEHETTMTDPHAYYSRGAGPQQGTFYGAAVKIGDGIGRTYFTVEGGTVTEVGVALSERALSVLPTGDGHHGGEHRHDVEYVLKMHPQNPTPYQHVGLNWNPFGHPPAGIYDVAHFDVHFYMISEAERAAIDPSDPEWEQKASNLPSAEFIPENYLPAHALTGATPVEETYPQMGLHWVDTTSPELHGEPLTGTFIYGSYNGRIIFAEPMITRALLESKQDFGHTLPKPQQGYTAATASTGTRRPGSTAWR
jgi:hypothetical protein